MRGEMEASELRWKTSEAFSSGFALRMKKKCCIIYKSVDEQMTELHNTLHMLEERWMDSHLIDGKSEKSPGQWRKKAKEWGLFCWKGNNLTFDWRWEVKELLMAHKQRSGTRCGRINQKLPTSSRDGWSQLWRQKQEENTWEVFEEIEKQNKKSTNITA